MGLQNVICMNGGSDEFSYAKNSTLQRVVVSETRAIREDAVTEFYSTFFPESMTIAELGCSSGPNALLAAYEIKEAVEHKGLQLRRSPPEFHLLLNDLPSNDFNTIFRSLPGFHKQQMLSAEKPVKCRGEFFVSGVPGSFYGRLFPSQSLHFVHSSSSLHWLSQVPPELLDGQYSNKGKIYISKTTPANVAEAYLMQFQRDFSLFLKSRGKEIVTGGHMVLTFMGRRRGSDPSSLEHSYMWELLGDALTHMASEGIVEEGKIDSFDAPYFAPSVEEVEQEIEREGSFSIRTSYIFEAHWDAVQGSEPCNIYDYKSMAADDGAGIGYAKRMATGVRAVVETMMRSHFGEGIMDELFSRYSELLEDYYSRNKAQVTNIVIALTKI